MTATTPSSVHEESQPLVAGQPYHGQPYAPAPPPQEAARGRGRGHGRDRGRGRGRDQHRDRSRARELHANPAQLEAVVPARPPAAAGTAAAKVLLLNATDPGEIRVAVLENGELTEIFLERKSHVQQTGNIYKGRVVNVESSLQAAFVDLGQERNGFLHASDCIPPDGGYQDLFKGKAAPKPAEDEAKEEQDDSAEAAPEGAEVPAPPVEGGPPQPSTQKQSGGNGRRKRRRRGGRGRSGRARPSSPAASMVAPMPSDQPGLPQEADAGHGHDENAMAQPAEELSAPEDAVPSEKPPQDEPAEQAHDEEHPSESVPSSDSQAEEPASSSLTESEVTEGPAQVGERPRNGERERDRGGRTGRGMERRTLIQEMLKRGSEVLVQVAKEGLGQKGPALTTYLSLPGRYLVLMPSVQRLGVSKRIESEEQRRALKDILASLKVPDDMGVIVRTAGMGRSQEDLKRDFDFLVQKWEALKKKAQMAKAPALLFQEGDVITRVFRDVLSDDVTEIVVDDPVVLERAREYLREMSPGAEAKLKAYTEPRPMFHKYGVESQLNQLFNRKVPLKSGGSIVIEQTEALVAIDVNTGRFRDRRGQDESILATNLEAAREVARQLRLRDIGGLVMIDFIDMEIGDHRRRVEREFKAHLARDKARINVLPISPLGIVEMTRQRVRHSLRRTLFERCPHCAGTGQVKSPETIGLEVLRELRCQVQEGAFTRFRVTLHSSVACGILNRIRRELNRLEEARAITVEVVDDPKIAPSQFVVSAARPGGDWTVRRVSEVDDYVRNS